MDTDDWTDSVAFICEILTEMHIVSSWISSNPLRLPWRNAYKSHQNINDYILLLVPFALPSNEC